MSETGSARRYGCPSCGGGLRYDIASKKMICDRCGSLTAIGDLPKDQPEETLEVTEYHCPQCGAMVYSTDQEITSFCSFCGSDVVLTGKMGRTRRPARIVPFYITREACEAAYRRHLKTYLLAPPALKKAETCSHFRPVYVPFWSYSVEADGPAFLEGYRSYTEGGNRYDETYDLSMDAHIRQYGILYDASTAFEDETSAQLKHTTRQAEPFHPAYLSGFYAQGADVPPETYESEAAAAAVKLFMEKVKEDTGMDSVSLMGRHLSENFGLPDARYREELVMMPVWLLAHRQGQRVVYTAVNGRDGSVVCDVPVSNGKVMGVTAGLAAGLFLFLQTFQTLKPDLLLALCALIALITQTQFGEFQKRLHSRRTRAYEPDFSADGRAYVGPVQSTLQKKSGKLTDTEEKKQVGKLSSLLSLVGSIVLILLIAEIRSGFRLRMPSFGQHGAALPIVAVSSAVMLFQFIRRIKAPEYGPVLLRLIPCLACLAGLVSLLMNQAEDLVYYACAGAILLAAMLELIIVNRKHNEYASRPVPFFGGEEGEEA